MYACQPGYTMLDPKTNKTSDGEIKCYRDVEWAPYPFPICVPSSVFDADEPADLLVISGTKFNHKNSINPMPEESDRDLASITSKQRVAKEQRDAAENDPMMFIVMGSLVGVGIAIGSAAAIAYLKLKQRNDSEDLRRKLPNKFFYNGGYSVKKKPLRPEYKTVSNSSNDSSNSEHLYDEIDETKHVSFPSSLLLGSNV